MIQLERSTTIVEQPLVHFGREVCGDLAAGLRREWLVTNGLGGYASCSGTVMLPYSREQKHCARRWVGPHPPTPSPRRGRGGVAAATGVRGKGAMLLPSAISGYPEMPERAEAI
jgi:hypothetical protein